ncbi:MAG: DNA methyltransferase [Clostridia bacterium]|nr:DNA methyltransferase [Clostridia bacterium]
MANTNLSKAKNVKDDECYTRYTDIQQEVNAYLEYNVDVFRGKTVLLPCDDPEWSNFTRFFAEHFESLGIKKLISTSYAFESKKEKYGSVYQLSLFESESPKFDESKSKKHGKIFTLTHDKNKSGRIDIDDLEYEYLDGDGDFRSEEVKRLRDEADIIVTNPPFSLFREFLAWLIESGKKFLIVGNKSCVTYKEVFPLIKENKLWAGKTEWSGGMWFHTDMENNEKNMKNVASAWFTNIEHGRRHTPIPLMTMEDNLRFSKHVKIRENGYLKYDNYDAIEITYTDDISKDYGGIMGVHISFLEKYSPEQFEILGATQRGCHDAVPDTKKYDDYWEVRQDGSKTGAKGGKTNENANFVQNDGKNNYFINSDGHIVQSAYQRIFIRFRSENK